MYSAAPQHKSIRQTREIYKRERGEWERKEKASAATTKRPFLVAERIRARRSTTANRYYSLKIPFILLPFHLPGRRNVSFFRFHHHRSTASRCTARWGVLYLQWGSVLPDSDVFLCVLVQLFVFLYCYLFHSFSFHPGSLPGELLLLLLLFCPFLCYLHTKPSTVLGNGMSRLRKRKENLKQNWYHFQKKLPSSGYDSAKHWTEAKQNRSYAQGFFFQYIFLNGNSKSIIRGWRIKKTTWHKICGKNKKATTNKRHHSYVESVW